MLENKQCAICSKTFTHRRRQTCSEPCRVELSKRFSGPLAVRWTGGPVAKTCSQCGGVFHVHRNQAIRPGNRFCSRACAGKWRSTLVGQNNPAWKGGLARAQESRKTALLGRDSVTKQDWEDIKARFQHRCPFCGRSEPDVTLNKDHIWPVSKGGLHVKDNIQPLCRSCNARKQTRTIYFFPDSDPIEITDFFKLVRAVADGVVPLDAVKVNQSFLNFKAQQQEQALSYPGVRLKVDSTISSRGHR